MNEPGGWHSTEIRQDTNGWWCGGICWESLRLAQLHQERITKPTETRHSINIIRHTEPSCGNHGYGYRQWFTVIGMAGEFENAAEAINAARRKR